MEETRNLIAKNLVKYRQANKLTQLEVAERLNYSDKAISKWERGEAFPDIFVFIKLAELYQVNVEDLLSETRVVSRWIRSNERVLIPLVSAFGVWFLFTFMYFIFETFFVDFSNWLLFIYAIPVSLFVLLVFNFIWGWRLLSIFILSTIMWTALLSLFLTFSFGPIIFVVGVPAQVVICLSFLIRRGATR